MEKTLEKPQLEDFLDFAEPLPELVATIPTWDMLRNVDLQFFDAFYLGQPYCLKFRGNLLANPKELRAAVDYLRSRSKKVYITTPAIPKAKDLTLIERLIRKIPPIDGIEVHEVGLLNFLRRRFPEIPIHVGHFANVYRPASGQLYGRFGVKRIAPSYELTMAEKRAFRDVPSVELATPIHGKLPLGMAFTCFFMMADGMQITETCEQQCKSPTTVDLEDWRMRCGGTTMLTAEDVTMIEFLPELMRDGYAAFRLETIFEPVEKTNRLGQIYRSAMEEIRGLETSAAFTGLSLKDDPHLRSSLVAQLDEIKALAEHGICNGWHVGRSGRTYSGDEGIDEIEMSWPDSLPVNPKRPADERYFDGKATDG